jgi:hypothetical protein
MLVVGVSVNQLKHGVALPTTVQLIKIISLSAIFVLIVRY